MYPTLYHAVYDLFLGNSTPEFLKIIPMFGLWVAVAFIVANYLYIKEVKRKEGLGLLASSSKTIWVGKPVSMISVLGNALVGFILGAKLGGMLVDGIDYGHFPKYLLSTQGNVIFGIIGAVLIGGWSYYEGKKKELPKPRQETIEIKPYMHVSNITMLSIIFGIIGAKLFAYLEDPIPLKDFFRDITSGLTIYGGLILGAGASIYYMYKNKLSIPHFLDAVAPALMLAYGIGRIGCQVAGDGDWGIDNTASKPSWMGFLPDWMWAYQYPNNVLGGSSSGMVPMENCIYNDKYCYMLETPVFPTPFYETIMAFVFFLILWKLRKKITTPLLLFSVYVLFNGIERFLIELIRVNSSYSILGMQITQAQLISLGLIIVGIGLILYLKRNKKKTSS